MSETMNTYSFTRHAGVDDLEGMGMGDQATEWWTTEDWAKWNADAPNRESRNAARVAELKRTGEYGKPYQISFHVKPNPIFDAPMKQSSSPFENYRMIFIDNQNPNEHGKK